MDRDEQVQSDDGRLFLAVRDDFSWAPQEAVATPKDNAALAWLKANASVRQDLAPYVAHGFNTAVRAMLRDVYGLVPVAKTVFTFEPCPDVVAVDSHNQDAAV